MQGMYLLKVIFEHLDLDYLQVMIVWWKHWQTPAPLASSDREDMGAILIIKSYGHSFPYKLSFNLGLFMAALPQFFQRCDIETSHVNSFTNVVKWQQLGSLSEIFKNAWINEGNQWQIKKASSRGKHLYLQNLTADVKFWKPK